MTYRIGNMFVLFTLFIGAGCNAMATERADFFDISRKPTVTFDKKSFTWTLRNQVVERTIQFDSKTGSLHTLHIRDLRTGHDVSPEGNFEGSISFASPIIGLPTPLTSWKFTDTAPPDSWTQPAFDDINWKPVSLPFKSEEVNKSWWFRCALPLAALQKDRAYAIQFDPPTPNNGGEREEGTGKREEKTQHPDAPQPPHTHTGLYRTGLATIMGESPDARHPTPDTRHPTSDDEAEIYLDGILAQKVSMASHGWNHSIQVDVSSKNRLLAIKLTVHGMHNGLVGSISLVQVGSSPPSIDLSSDWIYTFQAISAGEDGGQTLTVSMTGEKKNEGFDIDVNYQIYPGNEPYFAKWFSFTSHRNSRFLLEQVIYDKWPLPGSHPDVQTYPGSGLSASDPVSRDGILTAVLYPFGESERGVDGRIVSTTARPYVYVRPNAPMDTPHSLTGLYRGPTAAGAFLYQLFTGQYISHATPTSVPVLYNTWFGYGVDINAAICRKIIPIAADLGVKMFVVDEGWQTNTLPNSGKYGDWITDTNLDKFPNGLKPISLLVRENQMRFGLWSAPVMVNEKSKTTLTYSTWLLKQGDGKFVREWDQTWGMCFTTGWSDNYMQSMRELCRELQTSYLMLDSGLFFEGCVNPSHDHPIGHALNEQAVKWSQFCSEMRKLSPDFIVDRGWEYGPEVTDMQDEGWIGEYITRKSDPKPVANVGLWYKNADIARRSLYDMTATRPPFTIAAGTPCHISEVREEGRGKREESSPQPPTPNTQHLTPPTSRMADTRHPTPDTLNALEYHFTSIGAYITNVEIYGKLELMIPEERALMKKWIKWNEENRPWLAYAQPIASMGRPWNSPDPMDKPHVDGVMHLRNLLKGRYGYICLWNPGDTEASVSLAIDPADYMIRMANDIKITRMKDGQPVNFTFQKGELNLSNLKMAPRSWEIYELTGKLIASPAIKKLANPK